jgi:hypothetical protein
VQGGNTAGGAVFRAERRVSPLLGPTSQIETARRL